MQRESNPTDLKSLKGWILDLYPSASGQMSVWIIAENGERIRLIDEFKPKIYFSSKMDDLERLWSRFFSNKCVDSWRFVYKYANPTDTSKTKVLEITLKDCRPNHFFVRRILETGRHLRYQAHNCDLQPAQAYLYEQNIFPLAFVEVEVEKQSLRYCLLDSVESVDYQIPPLKITRIHVEIAKKKRIADFNDPL